MAINRTTENQILDKIKSINNDNDFNDIALVIFNFQYNNNLVYRKWVDGLFISPKNIAHYSQIPFLPISLFKSQKIISLNKEPEVVFSSSATTGTIQSKHYVVKKDIYTKAYLNTFKLFYGEPSEYTILALLPSYLEREGSSLIMMADDLIKLSGKKESGFYLDEYDKLFTVINKLSQQKAKTILIGVSFALLEFAEKFRVSFPELVVMETGGMKGRRKELVREELHKILNAAFGTKVIHSEYGMTELLSQAYSKGNGLFKTPPWMKILIRDTNDPLFISDKVKSGGINIIDLYNLYSCSFIATDDLGSNLKDDSFEIIGRFDNSDIRGCNLLVF